MYALYYAVFYGILANSIRYAARFNDDDATHKLLWTAYQFGFLLMLEGLGTSVSEPSLLLKLSSAAMHLLLALGFAARVAFALPAARPFVATFAAANLACAAAFAVAASFDSMDKPALYFVAAINLVVVDALLLLTSLGGGVQLHMGYIVSRMNGLYMEVLGVASKLAPGRTHASLAQRSFPSTS
eukprot:5865297-Prymnesium_polylepis.1